MRDLRVWQEHEPFLTGYEPHSFVRCQDLKYIETLPARRYKLDGNAQPFVFAYELQGCFSELPVKERLIEHQLTDRNTLLARCTPPCTSTRNALTARILRFLIGLAICADLDDYSRSTPQVGEWGVGSRGVGSVTGIVLSSALLIGAVAWILVVAMKK